MDVLGCCKATLTVSWTAALWLFCQRDISQLYSPWNSVWRRRRYGSMCSQPEQPLQAMSPLPAPESPNSEASESV